MLNRLLTTYLRRANRRLMTFQTAPAQMGLPPAASDQTGLLYLHIPFCEVLCPFCPFHRVKFQRPRAQAYFEALRTEIERVTGLGYSFTELYVGGGTPTVMFEELSETIALVRRLHRVNQVSVETNPDDLGDPRLRGLKEVGVTRLSVGVQSFDDQLLRQIGRYDKFGSGAVIVERLRQASGLFDTLNVDMIFNFPQQSPESLQRDLDILTGELQVDQVSCYPLMTASSTRESMSRHVGRVDFGREPGLYRQIAAHMQRAGYSRSSAWCFSRQPHMIDEYIVNQDEYVGLGSGAFGYLQGTLYASSFSINHYLRLVEAGGTGVTRHRQMSRRDQMRYYLLVRLFGGSLDLSAAERRFDGQFERTLKFEILGLWLIAAVRRVGHRLELTERGNYVWVMMMREFFIGVNNFRDEMRHHISQELEQGGDSAAGRASR